MPPVVKAKSKANAPASATTRALPHTRWIIALGLLVCLAYANSIGAGLSFDNKTIIAANSRIRAVTFENLRLIFITNYWWPRPSFDYRPFTLLTYMFNYAVLGNGIDPAGYHIINVLLHWLNAVLVYFLMLAIWGEALPAFLAGAVFALHPVATEAVANVVGRADLLAVASVAGGLLIYIRLRRAVQTQRARWTGALAVVATVGAFSKESAAALPVIILLCEIAWPEQGRDRGLLATIPRAVVQSLRRGAWAAAAPFVLFWAVRSSVFAGLPKPWIPFLDNPLVRADFWTARATAIKVFGKYMALLAWPATLSSDYSYNEIPLVDLRMRTWQDWLAVLSFAVIILVIVLAIRSYRRRPDVFLFSGFIFATLAPLANLVFPIATIMAERLLYLPLVGFAGLAVAAVQAAAAHLGRERQHQAAVVAMSLLLSAACVRTIVRNQDWATEERFFLRAAETSPGSYKAHSGAAVVLSYRNTEGSIDRAISEAETARGILAGLPPADLDSGLLVNLGMFYRNKADFAVRKGDTAAATPWYEKSAAVLEEAARCAMALEERERRASTGHPPLIAKPPEIWTNLAETRARQRRFDDAHRAFEDAIAAAPDRADIYVQAARLDFTTARPEHGLTMLHAALLTHPGDPDALSLLRKVYRDVDPQGCAAAADLAALRTNCAPVQHFRCLAYASIARAFDAAPQPALAGQYRARAVQAGCPGGGM